MPNLTQQLLEENTLAALLLEHPNLFENLASKLPYLKREFPDLDEKWIQAAYDIDPTRGKYTRWIVRLVATNVIRLPEDAEKVNQRLTQFRELSKKGDWKGDRDLYSRQYLTYGRLAKAIDNNLGVETKGEIRRRKAVEGAELVWEKGEKQIYKVTTVEGGLSLGWRNTEWCVKDPKYFDEYGPPFYCMLVSGKPSILAHLGEGQVMDEYDNETDNWGDFIEAGIIDIRNDPEWAFNYAYDVIDGRWSEGEAAIMRNPQWACHYASFVIKGRWPEAEPYIMKNTRWAYHYALDTIDGRWPEVEPIIMKDPQWAYKYAVYIIEGRWSEAEPYIMKDPKWAWHYASYMSAFNRRWSEAEPYIMKDPEYAYHYAKSNVRGRWPEAEPYIMKDPKYAYHYAKEVIRGRWPEAEPYIEKDSRWMFLYRVEALT